LYLLGRPERQFPDGLIFCRRCFFCVSPRFLRAPSTDRPETLPHGRNLTEFYKVTSKIRGAVPQKIGGQKHAKFRSILDHLKILIANISGTAQDIQNRPTLQTMAIPPAFDKKSPVNFGPLTAWNSM